MDVLRVDAEKESAKELFAKSLRDTGFAVLYNHPIDLSLIQSVYDEWTDFFKSNEKHEHLFSRDTQAGYFPTNISETAKDANVKDLKEFFQYYPWGPYPDSLSDNTKVLYSKLVNFASTLLDWIEDYLPKDISSTLSQPLSSMLNDTPKNMLRILHYPPLNGSEPKGAVRAAEHGDIDLLTLLVGATESGLQAKDAQGNWHDIPTDKTSIAVNAGDMLEMCTNQFYCSTRHRVINPSSENKSRLSMPLFLHPHPSVMLKPGFSADDYLNQRLKELGVS